MVHPQVSSTQTRTAYHAVVLVLPCAELGQVLHPAKLWSQQCFSVSIPGPALAVGNHQKRCSR